MTRRYAFFSTGLPDVAQGGSGIFNWLVIDHLLRDGCEVHAWLHVDAASTKAHFDDQQLRKLRERGLSCQLVQAEYAGARFALGADLLLQAAGYASAKRAVMNAAPVLERCSGAIALDIAWGFALAQTATPTVCIIADPLEQRLRHQRWLRGATHAWLNPLYWKQSVQLASLGNAYAQLARRVAHNAVFGSFSPYHAKEFSSRGFPCKHFRWFTPDVTPRTKWPKTLSQLTCLHVGSLYTTASRSMLHYWNAELLPALDQIGMPIEIRFVGKAESCLASRWKNIRLTFLGHQASLDAEFAAADVFLSPMKYPIGVRTRVLTALSYAVPVVADPSARFGLPELIDGRDVLYGDTPAAIAQVIDRLRRQPDMLERVGNAGRATWEKYFRPDQNIRALVDAVSAVAATTAAPLAQKSAYVG